MMAAGAAGAVLGPFVGSWFCDALGREKTLIISTVLLGIGTFHDGDSTYDFCI